MESVANMDAVSQNGADEDSDGGQARPQASFRLPAFSPEDAELWLLQVDSAFAVSGIKDAKTKFKLLVANLPMTVASQVRDIIVTKPGKFKALCEALQERLAHSRASRLEALLRHELLGDRTPFQLLRSMSRELTSAGDVPADSNLLRMLFRQRLPQSTRAAISLLPDSTPLDDLAAAADRFLEESRPSQGSISTVSASVEPSSASGRTASREPEEPSMVAAIASLTAMVIRLEASHKRLEERVSRPRSRSASATRGRFHRSSSSHSRYRDESLSRYCWCHETFGARARKCSEPCAWEAENRQA